MITGAGSGIGRVTAREFAARGDQVIVTDIDEAGARETAEGQPLCTVRLLDVRDGKQIRDLVAWVVERYGRLDVLINNAMVCTDQDFGQLADATLTAELDVNLGGALRMIQAVLPTMQAQHSGVILNMSSVNGVQYFGNEVYSAAKAGLINLTQSIAVRHGPDGIRCNAVAPGTIATPHWDERAAADPQVFERLAKWYPLGRVGRPEDVSAALLFLASDAAAWITGVTLPVDGGLLAGNRVMTNEIIGGSD
nr:SDR family oxidoreductase [Microlunatus panaciterrae]